jgi:uncharacterized protein YfaS (alpha-2-macroglobulin family)
MKLPLKLDKKKILLSALATLLTLTFIFAAWHLLASPSLKFSTIEGEDIEIATNANLEFKFNQLMNHQSVEEAIQIGLGVSGEFTWFLGRVEFSPDQNLTLDQDYSINFSALPNVLGKNMKENLVLSFKAIDPPHVLLSVPNNATAPDTKITVMFDRPMIELTSLDEQAKAEVPLIITPEIDGKFKWLGTSTVQFIPEDRLDYSTAYTAIVPVGSESLDGGKITEDHTFTFETERIALKYDASSSLQASQAYTLTFNQEVNIDSVQEHVEISQGHTVIDVNFDYSEWTRTETNEDGTETEITETNKAIVKIMPEEGDWGYDESYAINMSEGIEGLEGNLVSEETLLAHEFNSDHFLESNFPNNEDTFVNPNTQITMSFDQEVDLDSFKAATTLEPAADHTMAYGEMCDPEWEPIESQDEECDTIDDKEKLVITPTTSLQNITTYTLTINESAKAANGLTYIKGEETWSFTTADAFKISRITEADPEDANYKYFCVYTNNAIDRENLQEQVTLSPLSNAAYSYSTYKTENMSSSTDCDSPYSDDERYVMRFSALMNPETLQNIDFSAEVMDTFGQTLDQTFTTQIQTQILRSDDTNVARLQKDFYALTSTNPHGSTIFKAQNLPYINISVCRVNGEKFIEIDTEIERFDIDWKNKKFYEWSGFEAAENCEYQAEFKKELEEIYWADQYIEFNLEEELGANFKTGNYFIKALNPLYSSDYSTTSAQLVSVNTVHLVSKAARDGVLFWATDLSTGLPVEGVEVMLYSDEGNLIEGSTTTDLDGLAYRELNDLPFEYILAKHNGEQIVSSQEWSSGIDPWDYDLGYSQLEDYVQGYVYTDRPLYQPTHEVFFKGLIRSDTDAQLTLPEEASIHIFAYDSRNTVIYDADATVSTMGSFTGTFTLDAAAPLGTYSLEACFLYDAENDYCKGDTFKQYIYVEEYKKPEFKAEIEFEKQDYSNSETIHASILGDYFFGAPVADADLSWSLQSQNYYFDQYDEEWFSFVDFDTYYSCYWSCPTNDERIESGSGALDSNGDFNWEHFITLDGENSKIYTMSANVQDESNQSVNATESVIVHQGDFYVGVKNEDYIVKAGDDFEIKSIAVDHYGAPLSGTKLELALYKQEWSSVKKKNVDGSYYWESTLEEILVDDKTITTGSDGTATHTFKATDGGSHIVRSSGTDAKGNTMTSSVRIYVTTYDFVHWQSENNNSMEIEFDQVSYEVGDVAKVLVQSPYTGVKALVSVERGGIISYEIVDIETNTDVLEIPITADMGPNFYLSVLVMKGEDAEEPADFKLGYKNVVVDSTGKALEVNLSTDLEKYEPGEIVELSIQTLDANGSPVAAEVSIAVVDESLLALKANPIRDLVGLFYNRRYLGVLTASNLTHVLERISLSDIEGTKGGSGKGATENDQPRGEFEDTAYWRSALNTDANGWLNVSFTLPDNLTTWNVEVIAHTEDSLFGSNEHEFVSNKAVMIQPALPRFARYEDEVELAALIHNTTESDGEFEVTLEQVSNLNISGGYSQTVSIPAGSSEKVTFSADVPSASALLSTSGAAPKAELTLKVTGNDSSDAVIQSFPILTYSTPESVATSSYTEDLAFTEKVLLPENLDPELGELRINTGATLATFLSDGLNYLLAYPYHCTEQVLSRLLPNVMIMNSTTLPNLSDKLELDPIYDENGNEIEFDVMVSNSMQKLYANQRSDGGWGYWPNSRKSNLSLSAYVVFGLTQIQNADYSVDSQILADGIDYVMGQMESNKDRMSTTGVLLDKTSYWANNRAFMLFALAESGEGDLGLSNSLYEDIELLSTPAKAYLAMTLMTLNGEANSKVEELIEDVENNLSIDSRGSYLPNDEGRSLNMMTSTKATALALQAFNRLDNDHPLIPRLTEWLIASRHDGRWDTTQDNVAALITLTEYLETSGETEAQYQARVSINSINILDYEQNAENILEKQSSNQSIADLGLSDEANEVVFSMDGVGRLYYDMILTYYLPAEEIDSREEGFSILRDYYSLEDEDLETPLTELTAGDTLHGKLTVVVPEERNQVAVEVALPAGLELINFAFDNVDQSLQGAPENEWDSWYGYSGYYFGSSPWTEIELRSDRLLLFADDLNPGVYEYDYYVQVTTEGTFRQPPALVYEMYFPENFGRSAGTIVTVNE